MLLNLIPHWLPAFLLLLLSVSFSLAQNIPDTAYKHIYTSLQLPGYITFQGGISCALDRFSIGMNVNNITNQTYWSGAYNNIYKWPGAPRNILFKINWRLSQKENKNRQN